jgi:HK97 family phage major capsid protein
VILGDFSTYMIAQAPAQFVMSMHTQFLNDQILFRATLRIDGAPIYVEPITPSNGGANTRSPFVVLSSRS